MNDMNLTPEAYTAKLNEAKAERDLAREQYEAARKNPKATRALLRETDANLEICIGRVSFITAAAR